MGYCNESGGGPKHGEHGGATDQQGSLIVGEKWFLGAPAEDAQVWIGEAAFLIAPAQDAQVRSWGNRVFELISPRCSSCLPPLACAGRRGPGERGRGKGTHGFAASRIFRLTENGWMVARIPSRLDQTSSCLWRQEARRSFNFVRVIRAMVFPLDPGKPGAICGEGTWRLWGIGL